MRAFTLIAAACALAAPLAASAKTYQDYLVQFLDQAQHEERLEQDRVGKLVFRRLAEQARQSGPVSVDDLPYAWREHARRTGEHADEYYRLITLENDLASLTRSWREANARAVAHAQVDLFHVRHELAEDPFHRDSSEGYLRHAAHDLSNLVMPDMDRDGIEDDDDRCPRDPEDADGWQDDDGCPDPDNDADGIPDVRDRCPNQPETANRYRDADGCPDEAPAELKPVYFALDSAMLDGAAIDAIRHDVEVIEQLGNPAVRIEGHADSQASEAYNEGLGMRRAEAVRQYMIRYLGFSESDVAVASRGETSPAADNTTAEGRARNRRAEFVVMGVGAR